MRALRYVVGCCLLLITGLCLAAPQLLEQRTPRTIAWLTGDLIEHQFVLQTPLDQALIEASLPAPGPLNYWLTLRSVELNSRQRKGHYYYVLKLIYQSFYIPLDVSVRETPSFILTFQSPSDANPSQLTIPAWTFTMSPLRPVTLASSDSLPVLQADRLLSPPSLAALEQQIVWLTLVLLVLSLLLCRHYSYWPFQHRGHRAFAHAYRAVQRLSEQPTMHRYQQALRHLHQALRQVNANATLLQEDLPLFLRHHPTYAFLAADLQVLFQHSQAVFYADHPLSETELELAWQQLLHLAKALRQAERKERI